MAKLRWSCYLEYQNVFTGEFNFFYVYIQTTSIPGTKFKKLLEKYKHKNFQIIFILGLILN